MNTENEIYFSFLHEKNPEKKDETYFDPKQFDWASSMEGSWLAIKNEVLNYLNKDTKALKPYFASELMNAPNKWKTFAFYFWGLSMSKEAIKCCPKTIGILKSIPNLVSASVSVMEPNSEIKPHYGDSDAMYRCHLGLIIPDVLPNCGFRVGYEDRAWKEGKLLMFNDAAYHKAWNYSNERRVILIFDVVKPQYSDQSKWISSKVRGGLIWQFITEKTGLFKSKKNGFTKMMGMVFAGVIYFLVFVFVRKSSLLKVLV